MENTPYILIVDYGSQLTQLIARRIREHGVFSRVISHNLLEGEIATHLGRKGNLLKGVVLSGGPESVGSQKVIPLTNSCLTVMSRSLGYVMACRLLRKYMGVQLNLVQIENLVDLL